MKTIKRIHCRLLQVSNLVFTPSQPLQLSICYKQRQKQLKDSLEVVTKNMLHDDENKRIRCKLWQTVMKTITDCYKQ